MSIMVTQLAHVAEHAQVEDHHIIEESVEICLAGSSSTMDRHRLSRPGRET